jgi:hypothetical protein
LSWLVFLIDFRRTKLTGKTWYTLIKNHQHKQDANDGRGRNTQCCEKFVLVHKPAGEKQSGIRHAAEIIIEGKLWAKQILHDC